MKISDVGVKTSVIVVESTLLTNDQVFAKAGKQTSGRPAPFDEYLPFLRQEAMKRRQ